MANCLRGIDSIQAQTRPLGEARFRTQAKNESQMIERVFYLGTLAKLLRELFIFISERSEKSAPTLHETVTSSVSVEEVHIAVYRCRGTT